MKNNLILLALLLSAFTLDAQKYIQVFTKADGSDIAISLQNLAYVAPSGDAGGSVLVTGPTAKSVYVTDTLANIIAGSAAMLVELTEVRSTGNRQVGVSKQHVQEVVPSGASQTLVKLKNPVMNVLVTGAFSVIADSLAAESGGGGGGDGNGIYSSSDTVPKGTYAHLAFDSLYESQNFALGRFSSLPDYDIATDVGIYIATEYDNALVISGGDLANIVIGRGTATLNVDDGGVSITPSFTNFGKGFGIYSRTHEDINGIQDVAAMIQRSIYDNLGSRKMRLTNEYIDLANPQIRGGFGMTTDSDPNNLMSYDSLPIFTIQSWGSTKPNHVLMAARILDSTSNNISFYGYKYAIPNAQPSKTAGNKSLMTWTGVGGTSTTPAFTRFSNNIASGTTDGSGDLTITHLLPDATFSVTVTVEGTTSYTTAVHSKGASSFKVRIFNPATGAAVTATSVTVNWIAIDY